MVNMFIHNTITKHARILNRKSSRNFRTSGLLNPTVTLLNDHKKNFIIPNPTTNLKIGSCRL